MAERGERRIEIPGYGGFEEIGRGGFAVVYQAEQEILQRHVAVKVITLLDVTDDSRRRFRLECTTIGGLAWHPNIVTVFDAGDTPEGWPYLVMEYLPGGSFGDRMRAGPLRWQEVVDVGVKVAGALQAAHDEGAIHRDVKPDNILMGRAGEPKLGDFGIATLQNGTASRTGSLTATLAYAAPEVLSGARASAASDVYSLAATLHALCTGTTPFVTAGDEHFFALIRRVSDEAPADLRPLGVPDAIASAIEAGMAKSPADRPPTAAAFAEMLGDAAVRSGAGTEFVEPGTSVQKATIHERPPDPTGAAPATAIHPATVVAAGRVDDPQATIVEHAAGQAAGQAAPPGVTGPPGGDGVLALVAHFYPGRSRTGRVGSMLANVGRMALSTHTTHTTHAWLVRNTTGRRGNAPHAQS